MPASRLTGPIPSGWPAERSPTQARETADVDVVAFGRGDDNQDRLPVQISEAEILTHR